MSNAVNSRLGVALVIASRHCLQFSAKFYWNRMKKNWVKTFMKKIKNIFVLKQQIYEHCFFYKMARPAPVLWSYFLKFQNGRSVRRSAARFVIISILRAVTLAKVEKWHSHTVDLFC